MAESKRSSSFTDIGYKPQTHEQERMMSAADRVEACLINRQLERVHLSKIKWQPENRGWHGIRDDDRQWTKIKVDSNAASSGWKVDDVACAIRSLPDDFVGVPYKSVGFCEFCGSIVDHNIDYHCEFCDVCHCPLDVCEEEIDFESVEEPRWASCDKMFAECNCEYFSWEFSDFAYHLAVMREDNLADNVASRLA